MEFTTHGEEFAQFGIPKAMMGQGGGGFQLLWYGMVWYGVVT